MKYLFFLVVISIATYSSQAAIPKFRTISNLLTKPRSSNHAKIVQHITIQDSDSGNSFTVQETVYVNNGNEIKIEVQGLNGLENQIKSSFLYLGNQKLSNVNGEIRKEQIPNAFFTPLIYINSGAEFRKYLNYQQYIPEEALKAPIATHSKDKETYSESFASLSRSNGFLAYAITQQLSTPERIYPTLFISQHDNHIAKLIPDANSRIYFKKYRKYKSFSRKTELPEETIITNNNYRYKIKRISVKQISSAQARSAVSSQSLNSYSNQMSSNSTALQTFYTLYR